MKKYGKKIYLVKKLDSSSAEGFYFVVFRNEVEALRSADDGDDIYMAENLTKYGKAQMVIK